MDSILIVLKKQEQFLTYVAAATRSTLCVNAASQMEGKCGSDWLKTFQICHRYSDKSTVLNQNHCLIGFILLVYRLMSLGMGIPAFPP